jgi:hypothetical protein
VTIAPLTPEGISNMGAEPWDYFVPYRGDIAGALEALRQQEFSAGRYNMGWRGVPASSIAEAIENADADGTRSILDIVVIAETPFDLDSGDYPFGTVVPLSDDQLLEHCGTTKPSRADLKKAGGFPEWVDRGFGVYIIVHDDSGRPSEIYFGGYSYD